MRLHRKRAEKDVWRRKVTSEKTLDRLILRPRISSSGDGVSKSSCNHNPH